MLKDNFAVLLPGANDQLHGNDTYPKKETGWASDKFHNYNMSKRVSLRLDGVVQQ